MELGCDGVLLNTAIAESKNPVLMAEAMKNAVVAFKLMRRLNAGKDLTRRESRLLVKTRQTKF